jgi:hypothetical protein
MSDTPRTDAFEALTDRPMNWWDFARELEHDLNIANNWVEHHQDHVDDLIKENAALRNKLASYEGQTRFFCQCGGTKP